jgi:intraflagellar transport protein 140
LEANGEWEEALKEAEANDKIHLNSLYYKMAKSYEYSGELDTSIKYYEQVGLGRTEIPRMLWNHGRLDKLQSYISEKKDPQLYKWWAQYLESKNQIEEAKKYYNMAHDDASLARIACIQDDLESASKIATESSDPYASYHVARKYEAGGQMQEAIKFYTKSQRLHHAIRLAKDKGMDSEVFNLSLLSSKIIMLQSAAFFEDKKQWEKAATLYDKGGNTRKALKLAEDHKLYDLVKSLSKNVEENEDPDILAKNAQFLIDNGQYEKAVHLMLAAKQFEEAVELCVVNNVPMSEELVK